MNDNPPLKIALCSNFCAYYKPGKKEELACQGYRVVERLMQAGRSLPLQETCREFDRAQAEPIVQAMCTACDFRVDGCDFMLDRRALPCGGFVFLARLLETGRISIEEIK